MIKTAWIFFSLIALSISATAESPVELEKRFEIGGHFVYLQRKDANTAIEYFRQRGLVSPDYNPANVHEFGLGARLGFNFTHWFALEAEVNGFPQDKKNNPVIGQVVYVLEPGGRKLQIIGGPKIGYRKKKFGVFGKIRPGVIGMDRYDALVAAGPPDNPFALTETRSPVYNFNIDFGGVFELYPTKRTVIRFDAGDTWIYYRSLEPQTINPSIKRHNFQFSSGFAFRF